MRLTLLAAGSRGDIQPMVALGKGLAHAGHAVKLATHETFEPFVRRHGLDFAALPGDPTAMVQSGAGRQLMDAGGNGFKYILSLARLVAPQLDRYLADAEAACRDAEGIVFSHLMFIGCDLAEKFRVPCCMASPIPLGQTGAFPLPLAPEIPILGKVYNRLSQALPAGFISALLRGPLNRWRTTKLGLEPLPGSGPLGRRRQVTLPIFYGFSAAVVPRPADWPSNQQVTGYHFLDDMTGWKPSQELETFLQAGPPPVYIGFGSMTSSDPEADTRLVLDALARTGARALLATGWGGLGDAGMDDRAMAISDAPHDWLFPRMAAVVHHGGAGTTAAGLRAGVPSVVVPFNADQPFWGRQIARIGVGPAPIPKRRLTADTLAAALTIALGDETMRTRAAALGEQIRAEDGISTAIGGIEQVLERGFTFHSTS